MNILNLIIKQVYFDQIIEGSKTQEFREVRPTNIKKLLQLDEEGFEVEDEVGNSIPVQYDAIRFYVGYNKDRDSALVEVVSSHSEIFTDEFGNILDYEYDGKTWFEEQVIYDLGKILEKDIHPKKEKKSGSRKSKKQ